MGYFPQFYQIVQPLPTYLPFVSHKSDHSVEHSLVCVGSACQHMQTASLLSWMTIDKGTRGRQGTREEPRGNQRTREAGLLDLFQFELLIKRL